jgi:hypothetical protein
MASTIEMILTIIGLSFWFLFPIGMFLSVSRVDKNTDQIVRLEHHDFGSAEQIERTEGVERVEEEERPPYEKVPFDWHHPISYFREWLHHE